MKIKILNRILFTIYLFSLFCINVDAVNITECQTINETGNYYIQNNLTNLSHDCLILDGTGYRNITIYCNNFTIFMETNNSGESAIRYGGGGQHDIIKLYDCKIRNKAYAIANGHSGIQFLNVDVSSKIYVYNTDLDDRELDRCISFSSNQNLVDLKLINTVCSAHYIGIYMHITTYTGDLLLSNSSSCGNDNKDFDLSNVAVTHDESYCDKDITCDYPCSAIECNETQFWNGIGCQDCDVTKTVFDSDLSGYEGDGFDCLTAKRKSGEIEHYCRFYEDSSLSNWFINTSFNLSVQGDLHETPLTYNVDYNNYKHTNFGRFVWVSLFHGIFISPDSHYVEYSQTEQISDNYWERNIKVINLSSKCVIYNIDSVYNFTPCKVGTDYCLVYLDVFHSIMNASISESFSKIGNQTYNISPDISKRGITDSMNGTINIKDSNNMSNIIIQNIMKGTYDMVTGKWNFNNTVINLTDLNQSKNYTYENEYTGYANSMNISEYYYWSGILFYNDSMSEWNLMDNETQESINFINGSLDKKGFYTVKYVRAGIEDSSFILPIIAPTPEQSLYGLIIIIIIILIIIFGITRLFS